MNVRFMLATECPDNLEILRHLKQDSGKYCALIVNPDEHTDKLIMPLIAEYGANSESYLKYHRTTPSKYRGTGSGAIIIPSYIMPYLLNGHTRGIFYDANIQQLIETKIKMLFEQACVSSLSLAKKI